VIRAAGTLAILTGIVGGLIHSREDAQKDYGLL
jgi:hypothetical protein